MHTQTMSILSTESPSATIVKSMASPLSELERFLNATEITLDQVFNQACKFPHSHRALIQGVDFLSTSCTIIRSHASLMCGDTLLSPTFSDDDDEGNRTTFDSISYSCATNLLYNGKFFPKIC